MPSYYNNNNNNNNTRDAEDRLWGMTCPQCFTSADVAVVKNAAWICVCVCVGWWHNAYWASFTTERRVYSDHTRNVKECLHA